jgi:4-hydroxy-2-oxoheptanedioate aldolase
MRDNTAKRKLASGGVVTEMKSNFGHAGLAEYLGALGFDILKIDATTQALSDADIEDFARACDVNGAVPMVRLGPNGTLMPRYLGFGVGGFHVPNIQSVDQVMEVVEATQFPPRGKRGIGSFRANDFGASLGDWPTFMARANANILIKIVIEDLDGLRELPKILKIPEVDVVQLGLHDLAQCLGVPGDTRHPKVVEAHEKARAVIQAAGKTHAMAHLIENAAEIKEAHSRGTRYFETTLTRVVVSGASEFLKATGEYK